MSTNTFSGGRDADDDYALTGPLPEDDMAAETFVVWLYDGTRDIGVNLRIHPASGALLGMAAIFLPDGTILHSGPETGRVKSPQQFGTDHLRYTCEEPFRRWRYELSELSMAATTEADHEAGNVEPATAMSTTAGMPSILGPVHKVSAHFQVDTRAPVWLNGTLLPEAAEAMEGIAGLWVACRLRSGMSRSAFRYDQAISGSGTISIEGREPLQFEGHGLRGHVRGVRILDGFKSHTWMGAVFPTSGIAVGLQGSSQHGTTGGYAYSEAYIYRDGKMYPNRIIYLPPVSRDDPHAEFVVELACDELGLTRLTGRDRHVMWTSFDEGGIGTSGVPRPGLLASAPRVVSQAVASFELDGEPGYGIDERSG